MKKVTIPKILVLVLALATVAAFFLPMFKSSTEQAAAIDTANQLVEQMDMDAPEIGGKSLSDMKEISLFEFTQVAFNGDNVSGSSDSDKMAGGIFALVGVLAVLIVLFALFTKPVIIFILDIILAGAYVLISMAMEESLMSGVQVQYEYGIAHQIYLPLIAAIAIVSIWMIIAKRMDKKAARRARNS